MTRIDTAVVHTEERTRHFVAIASCGFDSEVNEAANAMTLRLGGTGTYIAALIKTLSRFTPAGFTIDLDGEVVRGQHMLVAIGNSISYGGGMKVTPDASVVDGLLDVCMLRALSKPAFLRAFPSVFRGTHVTHPAVRMARVQRIHVEADRRVMVYADGERVGPGPGNDRGGSGVTVGVRRPEREGDPMTDGLLLIHAFPLDARMWEGQRLGAHTVAPDLPGFGMAPPGGRTMTMADAAARCLRGRRCGRARSARRVRPVDGGLRRLRAVAHGSRADRRPGAGEHAGGADTPDAAQGRRELAARLRSEGNVLAVAPPPLLAAGAPEELQERVRGWIADQTAEAIAAAAEGMAARVDSTPDLPGIDVPTLVITGGGDRLIPPDISAPMADAIPGAWLEILPAVGHLTNVEAPARFTELLRGHLATCGVEP